MSANGSASSNTRFAIFPFSIVSKSFSIPKKCAGLIVAVCSDSIDVKPPCTSSASSSCRENPAYSRFRVPQRDRISPYQSVKTSSARGFTRKSTELSGPLQVSRAGILAADKIEFTDRERKAIEAVLAECQGRVSGPHGAAAKLGIPHQTLESKIANLGIDTRRFKALRSKRRSA